MSSCKLLLRVSLLAFLVSTTYATSGQTTRYWDCCKPSCAWPSSSLTSPVKVCDVSDKPLSDSNAQSGCQGGTAYTCSDQTPWAVNDNLAYGFAAVSGNKPACCSCFKLTFTSTAIKGKTMIVQATNTGGDVGATQFDLAIPGGGFGLFDACTKEWKATSSVWGAQYGGSSTNQCSKFPSPLQAGCGFRWDWMQGADNPTVDFDTVACPAEIVAKSGCSVVGSAPVAGSSGSGSLSSSAAGATSSSSSSGSSGSGSGSGSSSLAASTTSSYSSSSSQGSGQGINQGSGQNSGQESGQGGGPASPSSSTKTYSSTQSSPSSYTSPSSSSSGSGSGSGSSSNTNSGGSSSSSPSSSSSSSGGSGQAKVYEQCGGQSWKGATSCASGSSCQKQNDYYSQCLPGSGAGSDSNSGSSSGSGGGAAQNSASSSSSSSTSTASPSYSSPNTTSSSSSDGGSNNAGSPPSSSSSSLSSSPSSQAKIYEQCGGKYWNGPTSCAGGTKCQVQNEWYSQCLPGGSGSGISGGSNSSVVAAADKATETGTAGQGAGDEQDDCDEL